MLFCIRSPNWTYRVVLDTPRFDTLVKQEVTVVAARVNDPYILVDWSYGSETCSAGFIHIENPMAQFSSKSEKKKFLVEKIFEKFCPDRKNHDFKKGIFEPKARRMAEKTVFLCFSPTCPDEVDTSLI